MLRSHSLSRPTRAGAPRSASGLERSVPAIFIAIQSVSILAKALNVLDFF